MSSNHVQVYCGDGRGKSNAAIGLCIKYASMGKDVIIVQFLKGSNMDELECLKRLEPEIRVFRFESNACMYSELSKEEQMEEDSNIRNGLNYVKKVLVTGECDLLVVDEILGLVDNHIIEMQDVIRLIEAKDDDMELILTGRNMPMELTSYVSDVFEIKTLKMTEE
ncbi:MAG: cob(I)yrinic acid a,c-diamide adenosyltransferase [Lachnospiraceae bacterium]|nr:cob(I)yrinic acid a,c-diamide adenosyltransferase [Lachnospiraceae bacterium]